jgi:hypothetical protein
MRSGIDPAWPGRKERMGSARRTTLVITSLLALAGPVGCTSSASSTSAARPDASQPPASSRPSSTDSTGTYVPASGTSHTGLLFDEYTSRKDGYRTIYPGGWNVSRKGSTVRIAKFGNAIVVAVRPAKSAPKVAGVKAALKKQRSKGGLLEVTKPAREVTLPAGKAVRVVFTQARPVSSTSDAATLVVYRYILFHGGKVVVLSMLGPQEFDNRVAYKLIAEHFGWG